MYGVEIYQFGVIVDIATETLEVNRLFLIFLLILSPSIFYLWFVQQGTNNTKQDPVAEEIHPSAENSPSYPTPDH